MKGILIRIDDGIWMVKWSDLHSFGHGTHWTFTELLPESNSIRYLKDNLVMSKPLEEDLEVEFEHQINSYDEVTYRPISRAKLIFKEVDEFEKEEHIKEYLKNGGGLWSFNLISIIRDGGTIVLLTPPQSKLNSFYLDKNNFTLHDGYPTTDDNLVTDKPTQVYVLDRLHRYKKDCEHALEQSNRVIRKIKFIDK